MSLPPLKRFQQPHGGVDGLEFFHLAAPVGVVFHGQFSVAAFDLKVIYRIGEPQRGEGFGAPVVAGVAQPEGVE